MGKTEDSVRAPAGHPLPAAANDPTQAPDSIETLLQIITTEFRLPAGHTDRVESACSSLRERIASPPAPSNLAALSRLAPLLGERVGAIASLLFTLLEKAAAASDAPWVLLEGMVRARDRDLAYRAVRLAAKLAESGSLHVTRHVVDRLAQLAEAEDSCLCEPAALAEVARLVQCMKRGAGEAEDPVHSLFLEERGMSRRLAARLLDLDGRLPSAELSRRLLGADACRVLGPYLEYTRATHLDLLCLVPARGEPPAILEDLARAEGECGEAPLREVIGELGWARVNLGLEVRSVAGVSVGGSFPFTLSPREAPLLESLPGARRVFDAFLFVAHGGLEAEGPRDATAAGPVNRFREYNLLHSRVLGDILDIAPLGSEKVRRILGIMDGIVENFALLFTPYTDECGVLKSVYEDLRARILAELARQTSPLSLSAELTRLVQAFEDPRSPGEVRTLHGLKRYLHQRGLHLAFRLVETGRGTNRTVDLVVASPKKALRRGKGIRYVDFEPPPEQEAAAGRRIPYPVAVVAEEFGRQLLHGEEGFPDVKVFCYGNEVHYYLAFLNHPAFLRIDYSPPLQGGMIDLEYFGVSKYELSAHPNPSLDIICRFLRDLEFDAQAEKTRVHVRYDKERALDLADLCEKAESLFRLVPYLMDVDWVISDLDLDSDARDKVAEAWSRFLARWGVLPIRELLTRDRRGILAAVEASPSGEREVPWSGQGAYRDRFAPVPPIFLPDLFSSCKALGLGSVVTVPEPLDRSVGQIDLEKALLRPLRAATARGEIVATPEGPRLRSSEEFQRQDEGVLFAEILDGTDEEILAAARLARLVAPLERSLRFRTTGAVNGHETQRASLALRGDVIVLGVLRDAGGMIRLALFADGDTPCRRREDPSGAWTSNASTDPARLASRLRAGGYLAPEAEAAVDAMREPPRRIRELLRRASRPVPPAPLPGEKSVGGLKASPGRCVGRARFPGTGSKPEDFERSVLVAPFLRPEDNTFLFHAAGVVSTGGGILSHAGLIAVQFRKPALIIPGGWKTDADGSPALIFRALEYREEVDQVGGFRVSLRREEREQERSLREGDLLALDADEGTLRVLGQDPDTLALHEGLRLLAEMSRRLSRSPGEAEVLELRGRRLRARYQCEKLLGRLADPALACHAVRELLLGSEASGEGGDGDRAQLLSQILRNPRISSPARESLLHILAELGRRWESAREAARERIPASSSPYEVLAMRREMLRVRRALEEAFHSARASGLEVSLPEFSGDEEVDLRSRVRLSELRDGSYWAVQVAESAPGGRTGLRHSLRQLQRLDLVLGNPESALAKQARERLVREDEDALRRAERRRILRPEDGGFELAPLIGWKAANLAEVERLGGRGKVPSWFVVTDRAFQEMLDAPLKGTPGEPPLAEGATLREAIDATLRRTDLDDARKSAIIRGRWQEMEIPGDLCAEVAEAYLRLGREIPEDGGVPEDAAEKADRDRPFVAVRSSAREEDAETAARAGEFETFLFVREERALLDHLKLAWSGLWTERAIHNRALLGPAAEPAGGGVIVQRIAWSRVSGVLQTVNAAEGEVREMVINAGLGLGEGIVSGAVAADHVVVSKEGILEDGPLRFRYITADKQEKVAFNRRTGLGTVRVENLYHQRLRPALEYVELSELVRAAARLEAAYGYPLDIEFGIEGPRLWILQVRPVPTYLSVLAETLERYPLSGARPSASGRRAKESRA